MTTRLQDDKTLGYRATQGGPIVETRYEDEYQLSPRVTLRPGDAIRVSRGPYWKGSDGERVRMAARGVYRYSHAVRRGRQVFLIGVNVTGTAVIHVEGRRRNPLMPALVCRPYTVRRVREKAAGRSGRRVKAK